MFTILRKIAFVMVLMPLCGHADDLDNIQRARESAEMQYVNAVGSGKYKTPAERDALKKKYLEPYEQQKKEYFKSISVMPTSRPVKPEEINLHAGPKADISINSEVSPQVTGHSVRSSAGIPPAEKSPIRPEFVLDGSNVPKEIVFGVPSMESPKEAAPSPSPSIAPNKKPQIK